MNAFERGLHFQSLIRLGELMTRNQLAARAGRVPSRWFYDKIENAVWDGFLVKMPGRSAAGRSCWVYGHPDDWPGLTEAG